MVRQTLGIIGHSNGAGQAGWIEMLINAPYLQPENIYVPEHWTWKNIQVFTSAHGYPGLDGTPPQHTISEGAWLDMTVNNPSSPLAPHPHPSPYMYPNNVGVPFPNWRYDASYDPARFRGTGTIAGIELALMWRLSHYWIGDIGLVKLSAPGSTFLRFDQGVSHEIIWGVPSSGTPEYWADGTTYDYYNWYTPLDRFDWHPNTGRLYESWIQKCIAAKLADSTMTMDHVIMWMGDNDCMRERERVANIGEYTRKFISKLRSDMSSNGISTLPPAQIRIILMGIFGDQYDGKVVGTPQGNPAFVNAEYRAIAADDPYVTWIETENYSAWADDPGHIDSLGYLDAAEDVFSAIVDLDTDPYDAMDVEELLTVAQVKDRVRLYYSRGKTNTDASDAVLLLHINGAMNHIVHQCDDMAYWLRRRTQITLTGGGTNAPITMPKQVHRVLEVESLYDATYKLQFEMIGHTDGGRVQIVLKEASTSANTSGVYTVHYIRLPRELTLTTEKVPIPPQLTEWLLLEVCHRLAGAAAQPLQIAHFQAKAAQQMSDVLKNMSATRRATRDRLYTQRRLPNVLNNKRGRRWDSR